LLSFLGRNGKSLRDKWFCQRNEEAESAKCSDGTAPSDAAVSSKSAVDGDMVTATAMGADRSKAPTKAATTADNSVGPSVAGASSSDVDDGDGDGTEAKPKPQRQKSKAEKNRKLSSSSSSGNDDSDGGETVAKPQAHKSKARSALQLPSKSDLGVEQPAKTQPELPKTKPAAAEDKVKIPDATSKQKEKPRHVLEAQQRLKQNGRAPPSTSRASAANTLSSVLNGGWSRFSSAADPNTNYMVRLNNLARTTTSKSLQDFFKLIGPVTHAKVSRNANGDGSSGWVAFEKRKHFMKVLRQKQWQVHGKLVQVKPANEGAAITAAAATKVITSEAAGASCSPTLSSSNCSNNVPSAESATLAASSWRDAQKTGESNGGEKRKRHPEAHPRSATTTTTAAVVEPFGEAALPISSSARLKPKEIITVATPRPTFATTTKVDSTPVQKKDEESMRQLDNFLNDKAKSNGCPRIPASVTDRILAGLMEGGATATTTTTASVTDRVLAGLMEGGARASLADVADGVARRMMSHPTVSQEDAATTLVINAADGKNPNPNVESDRDFDSNGDGDEDYDGDGNNDGDDDRGVEDNSGSGNNASGAAFTEEGVALALSNDGERFQSRRRGAAFPQKKIVDVSVPPPRATSAPSIAASQRLSLADWKLVRANRRPEADVALKKRGKARVHFAPAEECPPPQPWMTTAPRPEADVALKKGGKARVHFATHCGITQPVFDRGGEGHEGTGPRPTDLLQISTQLFEKGTSQAGWKGLAPPQPSGPRPTSLPPAPLAAWTGPAPPQPLGTRPAPLAAWTGPAPPQPLGPRPTPLPPSVPLALSPSLAPGGPIYPRNVEQRPVPAPASAPADIDDGGKKTWSCCVEEWGENEACGFCKSLNPEKTSTTDDFFNYNRSDTFARHEDWGEDRVDGGVSQHEDGCDRNRDKEPRLGDRDRGHHRDQEREHARDRDRDRDRGGAFPLCV
jgi:hypothetical protein